MKDVNACLIFDGNCREAMKFYEKYLGADLYLMPFSETPCNAPKEAKDLIAHARLGNGSALLMASDTMPGMPFQQGPVEVLPFRPCSEHKNKGLFGPGVKNGRPH